MGRSKSFSSHTVPWKLFGILLGALTSAAFPVCAQVDRAALPSAPSPSPAIRKQPSSNRISGQLSPRNAGVQTTSDANVSSGISLYTIVDLALRNSKSVRSAEAEQQRARAALAETRDVYIPNFAVGSGLGPPSYGFPLGNPTLFNVTSNSFLFSFSQRFYGRSARAALKAAALSVETARQQVILETALDYIQIDTVQCQIAALDQAVADSNTLISVLQQRLSAGIASQVSVTRARLTQAQIHLRAIQLRDQADELRQHLANLTGLTADLIAPSQSSVPPLPDLDFASVDRQQGDSPQVQAANATADSKWSQYQGDQRQNYRPTVNFGFQYARFATFTGYQQYYQHFTFNNVEAGIQAVWPLFDPVRKDKALESKAEAERARRDAELARIQSSEHNLQLWHSLQELEAEEQVSSLQQQLAQDTLDTAVLQMNQGTAVANGAPVPPQQSARYRIDERTSYADLRDAQFNVVRVKLNLLHAIGGLEDWVNQSPQRGPASHSIVSGKVR